MSNKTVEPLIFADRTFSKKIERAEALVSADFVESRAGLFPDSGAAWTEIGGAFALFDGAVSPVTQTFCLGLFEETTDEHLDEIESFFATRGAPVFHEVSPMTTPELMQLLHDRRYRPLELTSVMYRTLDVVGDQERVNHAGISTRVINRDEIDMFARTSVKGWSSEMPEFESFGAELCRVSANSRAASCFIAELDGEPIGTGTLLISEDVAILAGASTIPEKRNLGAQNALLAARLRFAAESGCRLAIMGALPGGQSQINAQKNGFAVAYTRTKWQLTDREL